ncbi:MAG: transporter substrate-binding domain-containing protein [Firmicutes bacterium]|nr:transporter substrate-binding domain-containing protein [Bacillota bacterium]
MKKSFLFLVLILSFCLVFIGCGDKKNDDNKIIMVTNAEFPPYEYKDKNDFKGIDIEIANLIAEKMGKELEILDVEFDSIIPAIVSNKADIALAALTVTEDRKENVNFSDSYFETSQNILVRYGSDISKVSDLEGKKIGVQIGNIADINYTEEFGEENIERFYKHVDAVEALKNKKIDAVVLDNEPAKFFASENDEIVMLNNVCKGEEYAIAINKDNQDLLDEINNILAETKQSGELDEIIKKYIK